MPVSLKHGEPSPISQSGTKAMPDVFWILIPVFCILSNWHDYTYQPPHCPGKKAHYITTVIHGGIAPRLDGLGVDRHGAWRHNPL